MKNIRIVTISAALVLGFSAAASAQVFNQNGVGEGGASVSVNGNISGNNLAAAKTSGSISASGIVNTFDASGKLAKIDLPKGTLLNQSSANYSNVGATGSEINNTLGGRAASLSVGAVGAGSGISLKVK